MADTQLAVQSYCFREFKDNAVAAEKTRSVGLAAIELCGVHVDFQAPQGFGGVVQTYRERQIGIVSAGVNTLGGHEETDRSFFDFLQEAGARYMSVDFPLEGLDLALRTADKLAEEYGVSLGIHNHGGAHWLGNRQALRYVFGHTSKRIGLSLDTAWALDAAEDPLSMVEEFGDRLHLLHLKDFVFDRARRPEDVVVGTGNLDLGALDAKLGVVGFDGPAIIEYEGDPADPVPAIKACVEKARQRLSCCRSPGL